MKIRVLVAIALCGCGMHGKPRVERKARPAGAAPAAAAAVVEPESVIAPGIVEPWGGQVELSAQEPGWIAQIRVREGEPVHAGQVLAVLEDAPQRHAVELARADLAEAASALERIERGATAEELRQAQADAEAQAARAAFAQASAARLERLRSAAAVADEEADRVSAEARAQGALAERAAARLAELRRGARREDRAAARARVSGARARLELAEANLEGRRVAAPEAATVLLSRFHPGEFYAAGSGSLFTLGDVSRLQVRLEVDEIDAQEVDRGAACALQSDAGAPLGQGTVVRLAPKMGRRGLSIESPTARADVRVREVFVEVHPSANLIPGQRVWGRILRGAAGNAIARR